MNAPYSPDYRETNLGDERESADEKEIAKLKRQRDEARQRLAEIRAVIDAVGNRCLACDGPVGSERDEITLREFQTIYKLTTP